MVWRPGVSPSMARRNGTTRSSAYCELFPLRSPFCQVQGLTRLAHWSRLTLGPVGAASAGGPCRLGRAASGAAIAAAARSTARRTTPLPALVRPSEFPLDYLFIAV